MKGKPTRGSPFFGAFSSDRIPKATKDANVFLFIHSFPLATILYIIPPNSGHFLKQLRVTTYSVTHPPNLNDSV
jgi:hypothetical protein